MTTDPLIARLDALRDEANRTHRLYINGEDDLDAAQHTASASAFALVTAWPEIRARLAAADKLREAAHGWLRSDDPLACIAMAVTDYDAATAKGTPE